MRSAIGLGVGLPFSRTASGLAAALLLSFMGGSLDSRVSVSRSSNATMWDSQGRQVWAPAQLCTRADMLSGGWIPSMASDGTVVASATPAPIAAGCVRAIWTAPSPGAGCTISTLPVIVGSDNTFSIYMRYVNHQWFRMIVYSTSAPTNQARIWVDAQNLLAGTINAGGAATVNAAKTGVEIVGGGWIRVTVTGNCAWSSATDAGILFTTSSTDGNALRVGNGAAIDVCGPLLEPTSASSPQAWRPEFFTAGATYFGPRLDYDPVTLTLRGLWCEDTRTNLHTQSAVSAGYSGSAASVAFTTTDGWVTAEATTNGGGVSNAILTNGLGTLAATTRYVTSCVFKKVSGGRFFQLRAAAGLRATGNEYINVDADTGTITAVGASATLAFIRPLQNGEYWIGFSFISNGAPGGGSPSALLAVPSGTSGGGDVYGVAGDVFRMRASQLELAGVSATAGNATSWIPTFGVAATRAAEIETSSSVAWATAQPAGALMIEYSDLSAPGIANSIGLVTLDDGTTNNRLGIRAAGTNGQASILVVAGGAVNLNTPFGPSNFSGKKVAISWDATNYSMAVNGVVYASGLPHGGLPSSFTQISIAGSTGLGSIYTNGHARKIQGFSLPTLMSDAQLQALTA